VAAMPMQDPEILRQIDAGHLSYHAQTYRDAIESYQAALNADAKKNTLDAVQKSLVYERMGSAYRHLGLSGEALRVLERSVTELPQNSSAYYEMALCYAAGGQLGTSLTYLNKALENSTSQAQLKRTLMMAKTDTELEAARDMERYEAIINTHSAKVQY
jgi:tetratricopeptide (TPR) repeat protein